MLPIPVRRRLRLLQAWCVLRSWRVTRAYYRRHGFPLDGGPEDRVWYFAYGSNLHHSAFLERRGMRPLETRVGCLRGHRLRFNIGGRRRWRARGAPANIEPDAGSAVWGVLYRITRRELVRLDATEGVPGRGYRHHWAEVETGDGSAVMAVTYMAPGRATDDRPSLRYITLLRDGARAHGLPRHWQRFLDRVEHAG